MPPKRNRASSSGASSSRRKTPSRAPAPAPVVINVDPETWDILNWISLSQKHNTECDFGTHLECVASGIIQQQDAAKTEDELLREVELKFVVLQLLLGAQAQRGAPSNV